MQKHSVVCVVETQSHAETIVNRLRQNGFHSEDISVLFADKETTREFAHEKQTKAPQGAVAGIGAGGALGGTVGWLAGAGALVIPGLGPFLAAGPILAALSGAAIGATVGGLTGALIGLGIPEREAKRYEDQLRQGGILISVHCDDELAASRALDILHREGARDISEPLRSDQTTPVPTARSATGTGTGTVAGATQPDRVASATGQGPTPPYITPPAP